MENSLINVQVEAKVTTNPSCSFFMMSKKKSLFAQTKHGSANKSLIILYQCATVAMNEQYSASAASKNWLVMVFLTVMALASGIESFGVVQSICYAWMFDEGTGIKSQECAGIQILCEYIISSIIPSYDRASGLARQAVTGVVFAAPSTSEQPTLLKPTASLWRKPLV